MKYALKYALIICIIVTILPGCEEEKPTEPYKEVTTPEITSVEPDILFGGKPITINGEHFNPDPNKNLVRFGYSGVLGSGYEIAFPDSVVDSTTLFVTTPVGGGMEDAPVPVNVLNTDGPPVQWSDPVDITFKAIISVFADNFGSSWGIEFDQDGNCYVGDPDEWAIYKITPGGDTSVYAWTSGPGDIAFDRDGYLYICNRWDWEIYRVVPGGGDDELFTDEIPCPKSLDWDENGNMYVVCEWWDDGEGGIYKISPDLDITHLDVYVEHGGDIKVFNGYLYWGDAGDWGDGNNCIMKAPITAEGVGEPEVVYEDPDWDGEYIWGPNGINIDIEGNVYAVSRYWDGCQNLSRFKTDGVAEVVVILPTDNNKYIAFWGESVYVTTGWDGVIYKVYVGIEGAPPYAWRP